MSASTMSMNVQRGNFMGKCFILQLLVVLDQ